MTAPPRCAIAALLFFAFFALALMTAAPAGAHEVGATQVLVTIGDDGRYEITLVSDPDALLDRLAFLTDQKPLPRDRNLRLAALAPTLLEGIEVAFDSVPARPALVPRFGPVPLTMSLAMGPASGAQTGQSVPRAAVTLTGRVPQGAQALSWRSTFLYGPYPLVFRTAPQAEPSVHWLDGEERSAPLNLAGFATEFGRASGMKRYVGLGFTHILPQGLDHVLFVLGLLLLSTRLRDVLAQVTAFTLAHSVTLALSMAGIVSLSSSIVEPLIALSIAYVAVENLHSRTLDRTRVLLVFAFGLLHGLGFAGVLTELGVPDRQILPALVGFNVGVELGQLTVVAAVTAAILPLRRRPEICRRFVAVPASVAIAFIGASWTVSRLLG